MAKEITIRIPALFGSLLGYYVSCHRKVKYGHITTAEKAIESMAAKGSTGLSAYKCKHCKGFHIGHKRGEL